MGLPLWLSRGMAGHKPLHEIIVTRPIPEGEQPGKAVLHLW